MRFPSKEQARGFLEDIAYDEDLHPDALDDETLCSLAGDMRDQNPPLPLPIDFYATAANRGLILHRRKD